MASIPSIPLLLCLTWWLLNLLCVACPLVQSVSPCVQIFPSSCLILSISILYLSISFTTWKTRVSILVWPLTLDLSNMVKPAEGTKASAGIALDALKAHKLQYQRQGIDTIVVGTLLYIQQYCFFFRKQHVFWWHDRHTAWWVWFIMLLEKG